MGIKGILEKLNIIQTKLVCNKTQYNSFGKYYYRNCEDILQAAKPLLEETKTVLTLRDEVIFIEGRHYIKATATIWDIESEQSISAEALAREEETKKGATAEQVTGATSSYARKYALNALFCIDDNKDSDTTNTGEQGNAAKFESMWVGLNEEQKKWFENKYKKDYSKFTKKEKEEAYEILMKKKEK